VRGKGEGFAERAEESEGKRARRERHDGTEEPSGESVRGAEGAAEGVPRQNGLEAEWQDLQRLMKSHDDDMLSLKAMLQKEQNTSAKELVDY